MNIMMKGFAVITVLLLFGCASPVKKAIYLDSAFHQKIGGKVYLLPTIDVRKDKSASIDLDSDIRERFADGLQDKGYTVELLKDFGGSKDMTTEAVAEMLQDELYVLGPQESQSVLILYINDVYAKYVRLGYEFYVELTGLLLDKQRKTVLWKDKGSGRGAGIVLKAWLYKSESLDYAVNSMLMSFPKKNEVK